MLLLEIDSIIIERIEPRYTKKKLREFWLD